MERDQPISVRYKALRLINQLRNSDSVNNTSEVIYNSSNTYVYNWSLQPFSQDFDLASRTTYVVCVNLIHEWRDLQFNVDSKR